MKLSVIIPTYNRKESLRCTLDGLSRQRYPFTDFEAVVVSDGSTDGTEEMLADYAQAAPYSLRIVSQVNGGPSKARNRGIQEAQNEVIVFLDDDVEPGAEFLSRHAIHHWQDEKIAVIGPMSPDPARSSQEPVWIAWEHAKLQGIYTMFRPGGHYAGCMAGPMHFYSGNASVRKKWLVATGGFDESYTRQEDVELAVRMQQTCGVCFLFDFAADGLHRPQRSFEAWSRIPNAYGAFDAQRIRAGSLTWADVMKNIRKRNIATRTLASLCVLFPFLLNSIITILRSGALALYNMGSKPPALAFLSAMYNICYIQMVMRPVRRQCPVCHNELRENCRTKILSVMRSKMQYVFLQQSACRNRDDRSFDASRSKKEIAVPKHKTSESQSTDNFHNTGETTFNKVEQDLPNSESLPTIDHQRISRKDMMFETHRQSASSAYPPVAICRAKLRVAYLTESFTMGGVERSTVLLVQYIDRSQYDPILICSDDPAVSQMVDEVEANATPVIRTPLLSLLRRQHALERLFGLCSLFRKSGVDILHIQSLGGTGGRFAVMAARLAKIPVVIITVRGASLRPSSSLMQQFTRLLDRAVNRYTTSSEQNRQLQITNVGRQPDKVKTIYNAIDVVPYMETIPTATARAMLGVPATGPVIGTIGRLDPQKGYEYFLEMATTIRLRLPNAHFLIVGEGSKRAEYETIVRQRHMESYVTFTGYRVDIKNCLAAMDVFVLASIFEPFGLVLAEAMVMERPVVATNVGGIPEVVNNGVTGILVPPRNAAALAEGVLDYLQNPTMAAAHGKAGRAHVFKHFSVDRLMQDVHELYRRECESVGL